VRPCLHWLLASYLDLVASHGDLAAAVLGAVLLLAILYRVAWPFAFFGGCALIAFLFGFGWSSVGVSGASEVGAHLDPEARTVLLWDVHERFRQAVEDGQRPDPNVRYWQTQ
jgi:membrane associated rhomboid family serine protease